MNGFVEFFKRNLGFFIGLIIGAIVVVLGFAYVFVNFAVMFAFAFFGTYIQRNRLKVKNFLQNLVDKI